MGMALVSLVQVKSETTEKRNSKFPTERYEDIKKKREELGHLLTDSGDRNERDLDCEEFNVEEIYNMQQTNSPVTRTEGRGQSFIKKVFGVGAIGCAKSQNVLEEEDINYIVRNTAIDRNQVEAQFEMFLEKHPEGQISKRSFHGMMRECYPGADTVKLEKHIWRMYDSNQDGYIDFREFMVVLYIMSNGTPEENLRQIFRVFDINNDGKISVPEMRKIVSDLFHLINISTKDTRSEEDVADSAFKEMDENQDGEVTQDEFIKACLCQKKFSSMLALKIVNIFISDK